MPPASVVDTSNRRAGTNTGRFGWVEELSSEWRSSGFAASARKLFSSRVRKFMRYTRSADRINTATQLRKSVNADVVFHHEKSTVASTPKWNVMCMVGMGGIGIMLTVALLTLWCNT